MRQNQRVRIRVGGVHEYTNILVIYALMNHRFSNVGIDLEWQIFPSGSAPLAQALTEGTLDMAVILTDSVTRSITQGAPIKIVAPYVKSPLDWVFHVSGTSSIASPQDMIGKKFAISRFGSGGHLIALYFAKQMNIVLGKEDFVEVGDMAGAVEALTEGRADIFPWERLTTFSYVEGGVLKEAYNIKTPFPPFVLAASDTAIKEYAEQIKLVAKIIQGCAVEFENLVDPVNLITATYHRNSAEVQRSCEVLEWAHSMDFKDGELENVIELLLSTGAISKAPEIWKLSAKL